MKLVSLVRQKNGKRYFDRLVPQLVRISDAVIFLDDNSTDGSYEELLRLNKIHKEFHVIRRPCGEWSGGLDWNFLFQYVEKFKPDWLFVPDVDELLEESQEDRIRDLASQSGKDILGWSFPFYYLWDDEKHYRDDGPYANTKVIRLIRYDSKLPPPNRPTHATAVSDDMDRRMIRVADIRMWHFGYMKQSDREIKHTFYVSRDKDPEAACSGGKNYDHMIQAPLCLVPVNSLEEWRSGSVKGDCLKSRPVRLTIGGFFPLSQEIALDQLDSVSSNSVDELRISYWFDSMSVSDIKSTLDNISRVLRLGGRIEAIANDYDGMCKDFAEGDHDKKVSLQNRFLYTPHQKSVKICLCSDILGGLMQQHKFENVQAVRLSGYPYRLYMLGYKSGDPKW